MKPTLKTIAKAALFLLLVFLFHSGFSRNFLRLTTGIVAFEDFEKGGETTVGLTMARTLRDGPDATGGFLVGANPDGTVALDSPPYLSSFGLQGKFFCRAVRWQGGDVERTMEQGRFYLSLFAAAALSLFALCVLGEFGWTALLLFAAGVHLSVWLVFAARNVYLMYILKLLPIFFVWMLYPWFLRGARRRFAGLASGVGALTLLASLCQFDYVSNVVLGVAVAPIYFGISRGLPRRAILRQALLLMGAAAAGVALAILANVVQLTRWLGSLPEAAGYMRHIVAARSYADIDPARSALGQSLLWVWEGYLPIPALALPFGQPGDFHIYLSFFAFVSAWPFLAALAFLDGRRFPAFEAARPKLAGLAAATGWGLLAAVSWGFLMKGHMAHHFHINGMMFSIPFLPLLFVFAGAVLAAAARQGSAWLFPPQPPPPPPRNPTPI